MSTNNTKPEGKEIDIESQLIEELSQNGTDKLRELFLQWQSERTARLEQFNQTLQLLIDKPQLSPSDHTAPQGEEEYIAFELPVDGKYKQISIAWDNKEDGIGFLETMREGMHYSQAKDTKLVLMKIETIR